MRQIKNQAEEISERATASSESIKVTSQADYVNIIETARSQGLASLYTSLNITDQVCSWIQITLIQSTFDVLHSFTYWSILQYYQLSLSRHATCNIKLLYWPNWITCDNIVAIHRSMCYLIKCYFQVFFMFVDNNWLGNCVEDRWNTQLFKLLDDRI